MDLHGQKGWLGVNSLMIFFGSHKANNKNCLSTILQLTHLVKCMQPKVLILLTSSNRQIPQILHHVLGLRNEMQPEV